MNLQQVDVVARRDAPVTATPLVVLDTNVLLDWLVFGDAGCVALVASLRAGSVCWITTSAMRDELSHVLGRDPFAQRVVDDGPIWDAWRAHARVVDAPDPDAMPPRPRCTDPDDQKFVDLAWTTGARWLVSRDRALLRLRRALRAAGTEVIVPGDWPGSGAIAPET